MKENIFFAFSTLMISWILSLFCFFLTPQTSLLVPNHLS